MSARLVCRLRAGLTLSFELGEKEAVLGSERGLAVSLPVEGVSRRHARIRWDGKRHWIEDLRSTNGTFVNGKAVVREKLRHLDVVTLGRQVDLVLLARRPQQAAAPALAITRAALVREGRDAAVYEIAPGEITLGRSPSCNVVVDGERVSKVHARIERTRDQLLLEDLASANGSFVNGTRIKAAFLKAGDEVVLAGAEPLRVELQLEEVGLASGRHAATLEREALRRQERFSAEWKTRMLWSEDERDELSDVRRRIADYDRQRAAGAAAGAPAASAKLGRHALKPAAPAPPKPATAVPPTPDAPASVKPAALAPKRDTPKAQAPPPQEPKPEDLKPSLAEAKAAPPKAGPPEVAAKSAAPRPEAVQPSRAEPPKPAAAAPAPSAPAPSAPAPSPPAAHREAPPKAPAPTPPAPAPGASRPAPPPLPARAAPPKAAPATHAPPPIAAKAAPHRPTAAPASATAPAAPTAPLVIRELRLRAEGIDLVVSAPGEYELGRAVGLLLRIDHPTVSRHHARVILSDDRTTAYLQDQGGVNKTRLNGKPLQKLTALADGDRLRIGEVDVVVSLTRG